MIMKRITNIILFTILLFGCINLSYSQSTGKEIGEKSRQAYEKAKEFVCDSTGPVKKAFKETRKEVKKGWEASEPVRKKAADNVKPLIEEAGKAWDKTEPQRKAAAEKVKQVVKQSGETIKEIKEGWDKKPKKDTSHVL